MVNFLARSVIIAVLVGMVHATCETQLAKVMEDNGSVLGNDQTIKYHSDKCEIRFPKYSGKLVAGTVASKDKHIDFAPKLNVNPLCTTSTGKVRYKLQPDGNFVFSCSTNSAVDYSTHSQGANGDYFLAIDNKNCDLHILKGVFNPDALCGTTPKVWTSHKDGSWGINGRLYMGQVYKGLPPYQFDLYPQNTTSAGTLKARYFYNDGTYKTVWSSGSKSVGNYNDYYARLTDQGKLILVGIDYPSMKETEYFTKTLEGKAACYTLGFKKIDNKDDGPIELIAKKCTTRGRYLRK